MGGSCPAVGWAWTRGCKCGVARAVGPLCAGNTVSFHLNPIEVPSSPIQHHRPIESCFRWAFPAHPRAHRKRILDGTLDRVGPAASTGSDGLLSHVPQNCLGTQRTARDRCGETLSDWMDERPLRDSTRNSKTTSSSHQASENNEMGWNRGELLTAQATSQSLLARNA